MNIAILLESLRFYRLKAGQKVQAWFLIVFACCVFVYMGPVGDRDFSSLYVAVNRILAGSFVFPRLTQGNWITIGLVLLLQLIAIVFVFIYARTYVMEHAGDPTDQPLSSRSDEPKPFFQLLVERRDSTYTSARSTATDEAQDHLPEAEADKQVTAFAAWASIFLFLFIAAVIFFFSSLLFGLPILVFLTMMAFAPLHVLYHKLPLRLAMQRSAAETRGLKLFILIQFLFLRLTNNLFDMITSTVLEQNFAALQLMSAFLFAARTMMNGRLLGILYTTLSLRSPLGKAGAEP